MPLAEELERLSDEKKELNGWSSNGHSAPKKARVPRLIAKDGKTLYKNINLPGRFRNDTRNWFHLLIEFQWRSVVLFFAVALLSSWLIFGTVYYSLSLYYSFDPGLTTQHHRSCIMNVDSFVTAFLFSLESQATIGYGHRYMTDMCPAGYITLSLQIAAGIFLQTILTALITAKILRPKKRRQEMRFSRFCVIGPLDEHDHRPTLMIRLADIQEDLFLAESHVRLYMASSRINKRGERELVGVKDMNVGYDSGWDRVLLLWPIVVRHVIDENSPLYGMTRAQIQDGHFELIMTVEGIVEATGMTFQARTSFLPDEIKWGHIFKPMVILNDENARYEVHYNLFDQTERFVATRRNTFERIFMMGDTYSDVIEEADEEHPHHNASGFV